MSRTQVGTRLLGAGSVIQVVRAETGQTISSGLSIPIDDTIPQITEGVEVLTVSITPKSSSSILHVNAVIHVTENVNEAAICTVALFKDAIANAIAAAATDEVQDVTGPSCCVVSAQILAGSTSAQTFRIRAGLNAGTLRINGYNGARLYGGVFLSSITVTEIAA